MARIKTGFVNGARNQAFLAGVYRRIDGEHVLLQSNNAQNALPLTLAQHATPPADGELIQVSGHIRGFLNPETSRPQASLDVYHLKRPALGAVPQQHAMLGVLKGGEGRAIESFGTIKQRLMETLNVDDEVIQYLMTSKRQDSGFLNKVYLSGFVGSKAFIPPSLEGDQDGYIAFNLLQFPDQERGIPVRVQRVNQAFGKMLMKGQPVNVVASLAVQQRATEAGGIERMLYLRTQRDSVSMALASDFEGKTFPAWWSELVRAHLATRSEPTPPSKSFVPSPAPVAAAEAIPAGVAVSDEEI